MPLRKRIMEAIKILLTDKIPYQEIFFWHQDFTEHFSGKQESAEFTARYLFNSGQCSYLVGKFWRRVGKEGDVESGEHRYTGGNMLTIDDVVAMQPTIFEGLISQMQESIAVARNYNLPTYCKMSVLVLNSGSRVKRVKNKFRTVCGHLYTTTSHQRCQYSYQKSNKNERVLRF